MTFTDESLHYRPPVSLAAKERKEHKDLDSDSMRSFAAYARRTVPLSCLPFRSAKGAAHTSPGQRPGLRFRNHVSPKGAAQPRIPRPHAHHDRRPVPLSCEVGTLVGSRLRGVVVAAAGDSENLADGPDGVAGLLVNALDHDRRPVPLS